MRFEDLPMDDLGQAAFSAYFDGASSQQTPHLRLQAGSRAAAKAVVGTLRDQGLLRDGGPRRAAHGTTGGFGAGCRCTFCKEAVRLASRSNYHWKSIQGDNKVRRQPIRSGEILGEGS